MKCPKCGTERIGNGIYCTQCEYVYSDQTPDVVHYLPSLPKAKRCSACKTPVSVDATACPGCGAVFVEPETHAIATKNLPSPLESPSSLQPSKKGTESGLKVAARCPKCGTERTGVGDGIHCTECDFMFSFPYPDASSSPTSVHYLPFSTESPSSPRTSQEEPSYERSYISDSRSVSTGGGVIILFALLLLIAAWAWQDSAQSRLDSVVGEAFRGDFSHVSELKDLQDAARSANILWNLGVIIAVLGAAVVAFAQVRK